jgi:RNA polymerase sigma factor for flagellar operon FliA
MNQLTPSAVQELWSKFSGSKAPDLRRELVLHYLALVKYVVARSGLTWSVRWQGLEPGDLVHSGVIGLLDAVDRFRPSMGVKFETFAVPRIRGAILDELRAVDWVPRSVRGRSRLAEQAIRQVSQETGGDPSEAEVAARIGLSLDEYRRVMSDAGQSLRSKAGGIAGEDQAGVEYVPSEDADPLEQLSAHETREFLAQAVAALPSREQSIVGLYYYEGLRFAEIARVLEITESRVSQIHGRILRDLRRQLEGAARVAARQGGEERRAI